MGSFCAQAGGFVGVSSDHDHLLLDGMREVRATQSLTQKDISGERGSLRTWPPMALSSPLDGLVASLGGMPRMEGETWSLELPSWSGLSSGRSGLSLPRVLPSGQASAGFHTMSLGRYR